MFSDPTIWEFGAASYSTFHLLMLSFLVLALLFAFYRLLRGPDTVDRIVAFDLLTAISMGVIAFQAVIIKADVFFDICLTIAIITFLGTVVFARYLEYRARNEKTLPRSGSQQNVASDKES